GMGALGFVGLGLGWVLVASLVVLPASIAAGFQFPVLIALLGSGRRRVAEQVGRVYAANTLGSIFGAVVTGFWLIPALGAVGCWRLITVSLVVLSARATVVSLRATARRKHRRIAGGAAALSLVLSASTGPTAVWRHSAIGVGNA